jgi:hypothetical protein
MPVPGISVVQVMFAEVSLRDETRRSEMTGTGRLDPCTVRVHD